MSTIYQALCLEGRTVNTVRVCDIIIPGAWNFVHDTEDLGMCKKQSTSGSVLQKSSETLNVPMSFMNLQEAHRMGIPFHLDDYGLRSPGTFSINIIILHCMA